MGIYFVLYGLIFLGYFWCLKNKNSKKEVYILLSIALITIIALRHPSMGKDLGYNKGYGYLMSYEYFSKMSWKEIIGISQFLNYEKGYIFLNKIVSIIFKEKEQGLLVMCAILSIAPIMYTVFKKSKNVFFSLIIFIAIPNFLLIYSGLRQSIALGICFWAIEYIERKDFIKFLVLILLAATFHRTAIVFVIAYFIYHVKLNLSSRIITVLCLPVVYLFRYPLFAVLSKLFRDDVELDNNGSITLLLVFVVIYIFCSLFSNNSKKQNGYMNLLYVACICQVFGNIYNTALRAGYYFLMFLILLLPDVFAHMKLSRDRLIIELIAVNCFVLFGLYSIYTSTWAMAYPFHWFFEKI